MAIQCDFFSQVCLTPPRSNSDLITAGSFYGELCDRSINSGQFELLAKTPALKESGLSARELAPTGPGPGVIWSVAEVFGDMSVLTYFLQGSSCCRTLSPRCGMPSSCQLHFLCRTRRRLLWFSSWPIFPVQKLASRIETLGFEVTALQAVT